MKDENEEEFSIIPEAWEFTTHEKIKVFKLENTKENINHVNRWERQGQVDIDYSDQDDPILFSILTHVAFVGYEIRGDEIWCKANITWQEFKK